MILVTGPPCAGKTTWVRSQALPTQTVVDFDDICEEIGAVRYQATPRQLALARTLWLERLPTADFVIWANPTRQQRALLRSQGANVVRVMAPMDVCLGRAANQRPEAWQGAIRRWFATYEPSRSVPERVVTP